MIKEFIKDVGVDAGLILISDKDYYEKYGMEDLREDLSKVIDVPPGKYRVHWEIEDTWNGEVDGDGILNVTSGSVVISDPCYLIIDSMWSQALKDTDYFQNEPEGTVVLDKMGGDGCYNVLIELTEV